MPSLKSQQPISKSQQSGDPPSSGGIRPSFGGTRAYGELTIMSIENPTLAHFRHFSHFRHSSTSVEIALQIHSILTNKPKVKYTKINVNTYETRRYMHMGHLVIQTNKANSNPIKAKTNPIQSQFSKDQK